MILICGIAIGRIWVYETDRTLNNARAICELMRQSKSLIESFSLCGAGILSRCRLELLRGCGYSGGKIPTSFAELFANCEIEDGECSRIFGEFCESFGKCYRYEQLRSCEYFLDRMSARARVLEREAPAKKRIMITLILSGAAMLAILLS
jgi:hypothetical protein